MNYDDQFLYRLIKKLQERLGLLESRVGNIVNNIRIIVPPPLPSWETITPLSLNGDPPPIDGSVKSPFVWDTDTSYMWVNTTWYYNKENNPQWSQH